MIGDARIVALGEATHGTKEFFTMRHKILECLVIEEGFNIFAMEASWHRANHINEYVQTGQGVPRRLLQNLNLWPWFTNEVLDLIVWMHDYNQTPGNTPSLTFAGFDVNMITGIFYGFGQLLRQTQPNSVDFVEQSLECYRIVSGDFEAYARSDPNARPPCRAGLQEAYDHLQANETICCEAHSETECADAKQYVRILLQHEAWVSHWLKSEYLLLRDQFMAENVAWLLEMAGPDAKIVLWTHNNHIQGIPMDNPMVWDGEWIEHTHIAMGVHLREWFADDLVIIGFSFYEGRFNAMGSQGRSSRLMAHEVLPLMPNSHEHNLSLVELPRYYLDLRTAEDDPEVAEWFAEPRWFRIIGAGYYPELREDRHSGQLVLPGTFDIIIHFQQTIPTALLR
jgi:erythromycin esterase